ncbi:MAG: phosphatidylserine decarboxylase [Thiohalocapsa sp.]|jgi:phosphatidylserine decarboxylase|uniref:phosphatidylserine decarboxylase n=1 Tax=Thiohalocapsa sp. TaxID=2497641 RepID=UPI0025CF76D8|nr:phosphatidylserine decarboxylase [Thiohalocapsa sp.]MCG6940448.1 phosphatidylserine decarboxylase [Thiohalocapsa sp.]
MSAAPARYQAVRAAVVILLLAVAALPVSAREQAPARATITQQLQALIEAHPEVGDLLTQSIAAAAKANPDPETNPVQTLPEYYAFIDESSKLIPRQIVANPPDRIRDQILQLICYFYFLVDQPLDALKDKGLYKNAIQYAPPFSGWLRDFTINWGQFLNTRASWDQATYQQFLADPSFGLMRDWYEPPTRWTTFNEFFARYLRDPSERPIAAPNDPRVVTSPADSVPQGVWPIDEQSRIKVQGGLGVKLARFFTIPQLLGPDSAYADAFAGGVLTHTFLNVNDYHRYHFPVGGTVKEADQIQQNVALEVTWDDNTRRYDPVDSTGWQFSQTRGVVIVDTGDTGLVALIPMGMAMVSSVQFEDDVTVGSSHAKGDMLGNFLFGGSDFVIVFQKQVGFELTAPKDDTGDGGYAHLLMGEAYGKMTGDRQ